MLACTIYRRGDSCIFNHSAPHSSLAHLAAMLRPFSHFSCSVIPSALFSRVSLAAATHDPCIKVVGQAFFDPADALDCLKSFPFNETLRQNVLSVVSRVFDFYTFEDYYLNSPPPFRESTADIHAQIRQINSTQYAVSVFPTPSEAIPLMAGCHLRPTMILMEPSETSQRS